VITEVDKYVIEKVKERRVKKGFSQSQLAFELELSNGFIGMIESGKYGKKYSVSQLNEIAKVLECSPRDFLPKEAL
jgi:transcriptional regulator with XRE-family HTH domain